MSHPIDRRERFQIGVTKSKKRVLMSNQEKKRKPELVVKWERQYRNTTKTCSCVMCGNPRKFYKKRTIQELRYG